MRKVTAALISALGLGCLPAGAANEFDASLRALAESDLAAWVSEPAVIEAVQAQNTEYAALTQADIDAMDVAWAADASAPNSTMIDPMLAQPLSVWLKSQMDAFAGLITEVFVMDNHGLNVAQSSETSDFWQGDEDKWTESFGAGAGAVHVSEVELDESSQTYQSQVSLPVIDPASGAPIGAITFGIDVAQIQ